MVYDHLKHSKRYHSLSEGLAKGLLALSTMDLASLEVGTYPIWDDKVVLMIQAYDTKPEQQAKLEAHRRFIDIQYLISGEEKIIISAQSEAGAEIEARPESDIWFYDGKGSNEILLRQGEFLVLYPEEAHAPCVAITDSKPVRKAVVKVAVDCA